MVWNIDIYLRFLLYYKSEMMKVVVDRYSITETQTYLFCILDTICEYVIMIATKMRI